MRFNKELVCIHDHKPLELANVSERGHSRVRMKFILVLCIQLTNINERLCSNLHCRSLNPGWRGGKIILITPFAMQIDSVLALENDDSIINRVAIKALRKYIQNLQYNNGDL